MVSRYRRANQSDRGREPTAPDLSRQIDFGLWLTLALALAVEGLPTAVAARQRVAPPLREHLAADHAPHRFVRHAASLAIVGVARQALAGGASRCTVEPASAGDAAAAIRTLAINSSVDMLFAFRFLRADNAPVGADAVKIEDVSAERRIGERQLHLLTFLPQFFETR
jgi:hypothetical protein